MKRRETDWSHRLPEEVVCIRCLTPTPSAELDRLLWCPDCVASARRRATWIGWTAGAVLALLLAIYIWFGIRPDLSLIPTGWALTLVVAFYLGGRIAREFAFGVMRLRNQQAAEAAPPRRSDDSLPPPGGRPESGPG